MKKFWILGGCVIALIIIITISLVIFTRDKDSVSQPVPESAMESFENSDFSFTYPEENFTISQEDVENGENSTFLKGVNPKFTIQIEKFNSSETSLDLLMGIMQAYNFKPKPVAVGVEKVSGVEYKGTIDLPKDNLQSVVTLFQKGNYVYRIQMNYSAENPSQQLETTYNDIVSTFNTK